MKHNRMNPSALAVISLLVFNFAVASGPSFAQTSAQTQESSPSTEAPTTGTTRQSAQDLKTQLKHDKMKLRSDIKASGKDSDVVKADRAQIKQDKDAMMAKKAKKTTRKKGLTPSQSVPAQAAPSQPSS